ncbi:MAG: cytochrome c [Verrucomicrobia bacterium]|nr:cytochrome c [Verrucomicrobiota bacterium]
MKKSIALAPVLFVASGAAVNGADVKANWETQCAKCHGSDGTGDTKMGKKVGAKDYTDPKVQAEMKDDKVFKSLKEGMKENGMVQMKGFAAVLSDDEIKALIAHIRTFRK